MTEPLDADVSQRITLIAADGDIAAAQVRRFLESLGLEPLGWDQVSSWTGQPTPGALDVLDLALRRTAGVVSVTGWARLDADTAALTGLVVGATAHSEAHKVVVISPAALWGAAGFSLSDDVEVRRALIARLRAMGCTVDDGDGAEDGKNWRVAGDFSKSVLEAEPDAGGRAREAAASGGADLNLAHVDFDVTYTKRASLLRRNAITIAHHAGEPLLDVSIVGRGQAMRDVTFLGSPIAQFPHDMAVPFNMEPDPGKDAPIALRIIARTQDGRMVIHDADVAR